MSPSARTRERERGQILAHLVDLCCCAAQLATAANLGNKSEGSCWQSLCLVDDPPPQKSAEGALFFPGPGRTGTPHGPPWSGTARGIPGQCACSRSEGKPVPPVLCGFDTLCSHFLGQLPAAGNKKSEEGAVPQLAAF